MKTTKTRRFGQCNECGKMTWETVTTEREEEPQVGPEYFAILFVFGIGAMLVGSSAPTLAAILYGAVFGFGLAVLVFKRPRKKEP